MILAVILSVSDPNLTLSDLGDLCDSYGLSSLDLAAQLILNVVTCFSIFGFAFLFASRNREISALCGKLANISVQLNSEPIGAKARDYGHRILGIIYSLGE